MPWLCKWEIIASKYHSKKCNKPMFKGHKTLRGNVIGEILLAAFGSNFCYVFKISSTIPLV